MTDRIIDRDQLQKDLVYQMVDDMDRKTMEAMIADYLNESFDKYSPEELIIEVEEYYPHLLEGAEA
jgi:hypothetical protein